MNIIKVLMDRVQGKAPVGARRSGKWRRVRREFIDSFPECFVCGSRKKVEVHHKVPFHIAPDLELDMNNLISLCENKKYGLNCHLLIGHLGNYSRINIDIDFDAVIWRRKIGKVDN